MTLEVQQRLVRDVWAFYAREPMVLLERARDRWLSFLGFIPASYMDEPLGWKESAFQSLRSWAFWTERQHLILGWAAMLLVIPFVRKSIDLTVVMMIIGYALPIGLFSVADERIRWPIEGLLVIPLARIAAGYPIVIPRLATDRVLSPIWPITKAMIVIVAVMLIFNGVWGRSRINRPFQPDGSIVIYDKPPSVLNNIDASNIDLSSPPDRWLGQHIVLDGRVSIYKRSFIPYEANRPNRVSQFVVDNPSSFYIVNLSRSIKQLSESEILISFSGCHIKEKLYENENIRILVNIEGYALRFDNGKVGNFWARCIDVSQVL